ncbi:hypothetical protein CWI39_0923p0010 [Hamiltosporidium magnivora]|uniref:Uncharacterized protein n=2 Tax=Hamiltosporidium TaxID=1176354 RepID=A0A4Q9L7Q6_9MICR|nr:hypothetical protein CWI39_0923p0010 [Hamiltosporidium magnivora]
MNILILIKQEIFIIIVFIVGQIYLSKSNKTIPDKGMFPYKEETTYFEKHAFNLIEQLFSGYSKNAFNDVYFIETNNLTTNADFEGFINKITHSKTIKTHFFYVQFDWSEDSNLNSENIIKKILCALNNHLEGKMCKPKEKIVINNGTNFIYEDISKVFRYFHYHINNFKNENLNIEYIKKIFSKSLDFQMNATNFLRQKTFIFICRGKIPNLDIFLFKKIIFKYLKVRNTSFMTPVFFFDSSSNNLKNDGYFLSSSDTSKTFCTVKFYYEKIVSSEYIIYFQNLKELKAFFVSEELFLKYSAIKFTEKIEENFHDMQNQSILSLKSMPTRRVDVDFVNPIRKDIVMVVNNIFSIEYINKGYFFEKKIKKDDFTLKNKCFIQSMELSAHIDRVDSFAYNFCIDEYGEIISTYREELKFYANIKNISIAFHEIEEKCKNLILSLMNLE